MWLFDAVVQCVWMFDAVVECVCGCLTRLLSVCVAV